MSEVPQEKFKAKIEQGVDKALPTPEQVKELGAKVNKETDKNNDLKKQIKDIIKAAFHTDTGRTEDLAIDADEKQAIFNDVKTQLSKLPGGKEEAEKVMQKFGINTAEKLMYRIGLQSVEEQKLYERFSDFLKNKPAYIFGMAKQIKDAPWAEDMMIKAADKAPEAAFANFKEYADMKESTIRFTLMSAAEKNPEAAFKYAQNYMDQPKEIGKWVLDGALTFMKNPEDAFKYLPNFEKMPGAKDILTSVMEKMSKPEDIFKYGNKFANVDGAGEVLIKALVKTENKDVAFEEIANYKNIKEAPKVLLTALALSPDKTGAFYNIPKYADMPDAGNVLITALNMGVDPLMAYAYCNSFSKMPYAKDVILTAAQINPQKAFDNINTFNVLPNNGAKEVVTQLINESDKGAVLAFHKIDQIKTFNNKDSSEIMLNAVKNCPPNIFFLKVAVDFLKNKLVPKEQFESAIKEMDAKAKEYEEFAEQLLSEKIKIKNLQKTPEDERQAKQAEELVLAKKQMGDEKATEKNPSLIKMNQRSEMFIGLFMDPALRGVLKVNPDWIEPKPDPNSKEVGIKMPLVQARAMIARNLFMKGLQPTQETVQKQWQELIQQRESYGKMKVFQGRNVLYAANNEKGETADDKFGRPGTLKAIQGQGSADLKFLKGERVAFGDNPEEQQKALDKSFDSLKKARTELLSRIVNTPPPLTFVFEGHGDKDGITLANVNEDGRYSGIALNNTQKAMLKSVSDINVNDFVKALKQRNENLRSKSLTVQQTEQDNPPILIFSACYSSNLLRGISVGLGDSDSKFIAMGQAEYGQTSLSDVDEKHGSRFERDVLNLENANKKDPTTLGTVMKNEDKDTANPSLYVHSKKEGGAHQLAALGKQKGPADELGGARRREDEDKGTAMG